MSRGHLSLALQAATVAILGAILIKPTPQPTTTYVDFTPLEAQLQLVADELGGSTAPGAIEGTTVRKDDLFGLLTRICYALQNPGSPTPPGGILSVYGTCEGG